MKMNIAIWGMGISGISALKFLSKKTNHNLFVINQGPVNDWGRRDQIFSYIKEDRCFSEEDFQSYASEIDLIVIAPGIDPRSNYLKAFSKIPKICEVELAFQNISIPIVAVTGTNGKTTTVTLLAKALEASGKKVFLGGNIGTPFCEALIDDDSYDVAVLELSSFQLELMQTFKADVSIILNITKSHMERYDSFGDYEKAKMNITDNQSEKDLYIAPNEYLGVGKAKKLLLEKNEKYDFSKSHLVGEHYKFNFDAVEKTLNFFDIPNSEEIVQKLINEFNGVHYRLEFLREYQGVEIYNDGKSTNSAATESALKSFEDKKVCLILGGKLRDKTQDLSFINEFSRVQVLAFGDAGDYISRNIKGSKSFSELEDVVKSIDWNEIDILLFSPAFPSFDLYKDYIHRAKHFEELVKNLS